MSDAPTTSTPRPAEAAEPPSLELKVAVAVAAIPQIAALLAGGYGRLVVIVPLALTLTLFDVVALALATLQLRADRAASRPTHPLVWITMALAVPWVLYALYLGAISAMVQIFCINQLCRGPIR